jgi:hypothetical protein
MQSPDAVEGGGLQRVADPPLDVVERQELALLWLRALDTHVRHVVIT